MLWFTLWFAVALKLPALYLAYVIWWSVKDPPAAEPGNFQEGIDAGDGGPGPRGPRAPAHDRRRRPHGPHGSPERRPRRRAPVTVRAARAR
jgi:hypothetical protein